jgi:2-hydroxy-3-keto-5-methylthiopentenyl-1-phosphate phosphatase
MNAGKWAVVTDFDGTITLKDVGDSILRHFKVSTKEEIGLSYAPNVKMEVWMKKYFRPTASKKNIEAYVLDSTRLRGGFREFHAFCAGANVPLEIVSGGVDLYIDCLLKEWGLKIKSFYGFTRFSAGGLRLTFPCLKGTTLDAFKARRVRHYRRLGYKVAFCGDGTSDLKAARAADAVFATKRLRRYCLEEGVRNRQLKNFFDVKKYISLRLMPQSKL